jgi:hypothetical protein
LNKLLRRQEAQSVVASKNVATVKLLPSLAVDNLFVRPSIRIAATPLGERGIAANGVSWKCRAQLFDEVLCVRLHAAFSNETYRGATLGKNRYPEFRASDARGSLASSIANRGAAGYHPRASQITE